MTLKGQTRDPITLTAQYLENYLSYRDFKFGLHFCSFVSRMPSGRTNNFPDSGRGLGHVTPTILAVRSAILATAWLLVYVCISGIIDHILSPPQDTSVQEVFS